MPINPDYARKARIAILAADASFDIRQVISTLPSIDVVSYELALVELERDLLTAKSKLTAFFRSTARQRPSPNAKPTHVIPKVQQKRYPR